MRGLETPVSKIRGKVLEEVARAAYEATDVKQALEAIPYSISPTDEPKYRESVWRERAIASERVRLAMGLSLRPSNKAVHLTSGFEDSNIAEKYYEPPLMQVIPSACDGCIDNMYEVTNMCRGCVAHPCEEVCPKGAITRVNGKAYIDQEKCIKCGRCKAICPYDAIAKKERPCSKACGVKAIETDELGRATINSDLCVSCGQCMVSCPFGAIADKSQIYQLIQAIKTGDTVFAEIAPAFEGQFGADVTPKQVFGALKDIGFSDVYEVALGADIGAVSEAHHYAEKVATGELPFLLTSCCPAWAMLAKKQFPETIDSISEELTPMVATARSIKKEFPNSKVVFIGPCAAKKLEASRRTVRSDVDFVITFEELAAIFRARDIDFNNYDKGRAMHDATGAGRGYAVAGGVASAIEQCLNEYYPDVPVHIEHAEGLEECKKMLLLAKAGKKDGCLIEGMGCPGGCIAGAGTIAPIKDARMAVQKSVKDSTVKLPPSDVLDIKLD
ncbi:MAG: 4Fe-4S dicluster domain-containing protein [Lachnospiraceae bacterium]|nr:4Fe-4S dicluster domain-containing protein [Lachnospiraceae bacterium]